MERYSMFLGRKNQYCENDYTTKCNLQINEIPIKLPMAFSLELEKKKWSSHHSQQKSPKCNIWMQSQKRQNDFCLFPKQIVQYHSNPSL